VLTNSPESKFCGTPPLIWRVGLALVVVLGIGLRVWDLGARPMHADEANQAVKLGELVERGDYRFDPTDHHGPTLYYFAQMSMWLGGARSLAEMTETSVRLTPAIFGSLTLLLLWLVAYPFGRGAAVFAVLLLAVSPPAIYYSRYFIQETLLVAFTLLAWWGGCNWWRSEKPGWALVMGTGVGLMLATKASALALVLLSLGAVFVADRRGARPWRHWRTMAGAGVTALFVAVIFYSSFGRHWGGAFDALASFSPMGDKAFAGTSGHEKPWWYYGSLFVFQHNGGYLWDQSGLILLGVAGGLGAWRGGNRQVRFASAYVVLLGLILSATPYKTPWIAINFLPGLCLLAGAALVRWRWPVAVLVGIGVVAELGWQTRQAVFLRPADPRNPYAYQHAVPDVLKFSALAAAAPAGAIKVISPEFWPLPWYLRSRPEVGYWKTPPDDCDAELVIVSAEQAEAVRTRLRDNYRPAMLGLRPGFVLVVFVRESAVTPQARGRNRESSRFHPPEE
jgi:uncharacterized protein (TIGR03663 family)